MIRVMVIAGVRLYRDGLCEVVERQHETVVVAAAPSVRDALGLMAASRPTVVLLDAGFGSAVSSVSALLATDPTVRVVAVGVQDDEEEVLAWAEAGAAGYLSCESSVEEVAGVVRRAASGELECSPRIAGALLQRLWRVTAERRGDGGCVRRPDDRLTRREHEVVELIARGLSNKQIARALGVRLPTVKNHVHNIYEKLEVHRRGDALARLGRSFSFDTSNPESQAARY